jgi:hypothetical protein
MKGNADIATYTAATAARVATLGEHEAAIVDLRAELADTRTKLADALSDSERAWARVRLLEDRLLLVLRAAQGK